MKDEKDYYLTTAITYTSGKPHIGNTYEIILADAIARFKRQEGYNVRFQTGTDEHGQKIEIKEKSKTNPQVVRALELTNQTGMVDWVNVDKEKVFGIFTRIPAREEVVIPVEERLIVELYSK